MSMNKVMLIGRLVRDPELKYTPSGAAVANFNLAVGRTFPNQNGEYEADFIQIVVWKKQAENVANYTHKGSNVAIVGRLQTRNYDDKDGKKVYVTEVVAESVQFLDPKGTTHNNDSSPSHGYEEPNQTFDISDSDLPF